MDTPPRFADRAIVLGGASCVWLDVAALERMYGVWDGLVIAANDVGVHWRRRLDGWTSLHPDKLMRADPNDRHKLSWLAQREMRGGNRPQIWGRRNRFGVEHQINEQIPGGSSGLLAVQVAWAMGAERVVLCGVPMTKSPHFAESQDHGPQPWRSADSHWRPWAKNLGRLNNVRSMSGRTRETLGLPTAEWIQGADDE